MGGNEPKTRRLAKRSACRILPTWVNTLFIVRATFSRAVYLPPKASKQNRPCNMGQVLRYIPRDACQEELINSAPASTPKFWSNWERRARERQMEPPASPLLKIKRRLQSAALSAGKWAAFCCSQNGQARPPGCEQPGAAAGTGRAKQNLAPCGQLTPEGEWGGTCWAPLASSLPQTQLRARSLCREGMWRGRTIRESWECRF